MLKEVIPMKETIKSLDYSTVITAMLCDVQTLHSDVFTTSALEHTLNKVRSRVEREGVGFLTKTLPRLGKALDKALAKQTPLNAVQLGFDPRPNSNLPVFLGELFSKVLAPNGEVLPDADVECVRSLRQLLFVFYKLELPYEPELEQEVVSKFKQTEIDILPYSNACNSIATLLDRNCRALDSVKPSWVPQLIRRARRYLFQALRTLDSADIFPRHGPGAVSTREKLHDKYRWTCIPDRLLQEFSLDEYFYASLTHVCDDLDQIKILGDQELYARLVLVPKDSRGPRTISCEPLAFQWVQQGLAEAIKRHVCTKPFYNSQRKRWEVMGDNVRFDDQDPNRFAALMGSMRGEYDTLDLNEASDRVTLGLVRLLIPQPLLKRLLASRSLGTRLPDGTVLELHKFAPMGSALCFPVLALIVWTLLRCGLEIFGAADEEISSVYVYGDDVVVPHKYAKHAMSILESFGLKVNRDKSCTDGLFRESCGMDAFRGKCVTPVRIKTLWSSHRRPESYASWIAYANSMYDRKYYQTYQKMVGMLLDLYGPIPSDAIARKSCPSLRVLPDETLAPRKRWSSDFQRFEHKVYTLVPKKTEFELFGWEMLLRYFSEACSNYNLSRSSSNEDDQSFVRKLPLNWEETWQSLERENTAFSVREYTWPKRVNLRRSWR